MSALFITASRFTFLLLWFFVLAGLLWILCLICGRNPSTLWYDGDLILKIASLELVGASDRKREGKRSMMICFVFLCVLTFVRGEIYPSTCPALGAGNGEAVRSGEMLLEISAYRNWRSGKMELWGSAAVNNQVFYGGMEDSQIEYDFGKFLVFRCFQVFHNVHKLLFNTVSSATMHLARKRVQKCGHGKMTFISIQVQCSVNKKSIRLSRMNETNLKKQVLRVAFFLDGSNNSWIADKNFQGEDRTMLRLWTELSTYRQYLISSCNNDVKVLSELYGEFRRMALSYDEELKLNFMPVIRSSSERLFRADDLKCSFSRWLGAEGEFAVCEYSGWGVSKLGKIEIFAEEPLTFDMVWKTVKMRSSGAYTSLFRDDVTWGLISLDKWVGDKYFCMCTNKESGDNVIVTLPEKNVEKSIQIYNEGSTMLAFAEITSIMVNLMFMGAVAVCVGILGISCFVGLKEIIYFIFVSVNSMWPFCNKLLTTAVNCFFKGRTFVRRELKI
uniref:U21 n=1 Tax=Human herpesvirus 6B TaxID=32604 RepID=A0A2P1E5C8_HHV6H|nr:U21 [Human betaherpesvirus 6B]